MPTTAPPIYVSLLDPVLHLLISLALLAAYGALRWHGVDEPVLLGLLGGQLGGLGITQVAQRVAVAQAAAPSPSEPGPVTPTGGG